MYDLRENTASKQNENMDSKMQLQYPTFSECVEKSPQMFEYVFHLGIINGTLLSTFLPNQ